MIGLYKHFKNKWYVKLFEVRNCDNCKEIYTVYMSLYKKDFPRFTLWFRPKKEFDEILNINGNKIKRFKKIL